MNGTYFKSSDFPNNLNLNEISEDNSTLFKKNTGKKVKVYATFPESNEWRDKIFSSIIEGVSNSSLIVSDPSSGNWYMIPLINICFIEFEEKII